MPPTTWADVVAEARTHIATPWRHQGRQPGAGLDCAGLAIVVARAMGQHPPDVSAYARLPDGHTLRAVMQSAGWPECVPQAGAVALLRFDGEEQHIGILADYLHGGLSLVHAAAARGRVVEHRLDAAWRRRITGAWALPGVHYTGAPQ